MDAKQKLLSETSYLGDSSPRGIFPLSILTCLLINLNLNTRHKLAKHSLKELKTVKARQHKRQIKIMNSENAPKEIVKSFIDLANVAKGFINENQPS